MTDIREALRTSEELRQLRRFARQHRLSLRRSRRAAHRGRIVFLLGEHGPAGLGVYGTVRFTRGGRLADATLFGAEHPTRVSPAALERRITAGARADATMPPIELVHASIDTSTIDLVHPITESIPIVLTELPPEEILEPEHKLTEFTPLSKVKTAWVQALAALALTTGGILAAVAGGGFQHAPMTLSGITAVALGLPLVITAVRRHDRALAARVVG